MTPDAAKAYGLIDDIIQNPDAVAALAATAASDKPKSEKA